MNRLASFLVFFSVVCALLGGIHYYLWARLVRDMALSPAWQRALTVAVIVLCVSVPATLVGSRFLPRNITELWLRPSYTWIGVMWLLLVALLVVDGVLLAVLGASRLGGAPFDPERRATLSRLFAFAGAALGGGAALLALVEGYRFRVKRVEVPLGKLPAALDGITIVQISDVHIGPTLGRSFMERVVETINGLKPDVVVITGDLVDGSVANLSSAVAPLSGIEARYGAFFVTGNHEYYSGAAAWCSHLTSLGVRVLRNERVAIGEGEHCFDLAGIDDFHAHGLEDGHGADIDRALHGRDTELVLVLLAHQPRAVHGAERHGVDLQLSGHTHGGQLWPFNWLVKLQQPVVSGLRQIGRTLVYVSNGTGYWGPPMRLAAPAEVTQIVLRAVPRVEVS